VEEIGLGCTRHQGSDRDTRTLRACHEITETVKAENVLYLV
jgi:hypothetical protein